MAFPRCDGFVVNRKKDTRVEWGRQVDNLEFLRNRVNSGNNHLKQKFNNAEASIKFPVKHDCLKMPVSKRNDVYGDEYSESCCDQTL